MLDLLDTVRASMPKCNDFKPSGAYAHVERPRAKTGRARGETSASSVSRDSREEDSQPQTDSVTAVGRSST